VGSDADIHADLKDGDMWNNSAQCLVSPSVVEFSNYIRREFDDLRLRMQQLELDISAASTNVNKCCSCLEQQFADHTVYEEQQRSMLAKMVNEALDVAQEARSQVTHELRALSLASTPPVSCSETPAVKVGLPCVSRPASMPVVVRPAGTGASCLDVQPCTPPGTEQHAAQSDMLQDLDKVAQQLKDAACGLSASACPMTMQPSLDSNGATTPRAGLGEARLQSPSPTVGGALTPGVSRLNSCGVPIHCQVTPPAPPHFWGAPHDNSSMLSISGREAPVPRPHMNTMLSTRGQIGQLEIGPPSIRTSLGRSYLPSAEQATSHVGVFGTVEGAASDLSSSIRRLEACPPHFASKSTSSPDLQRFSHACLAARAASPLQRVLP